MQYVSDFSEVVSRETYSCSFRDLFRSLRIINFIVVLLLKLNIIELSKCKIFFFLEFISRLLPELFSLQSSQIFLEIFFDCIHKTCGTFLTIKKMNTDTGNSGWKEDGFQFPVTGISHRFNNCLINRFNNLLDKLILLDIHSLFSIFQKIFPKYGHKDFRPPIIKHKKFSFINFLLSYFTSHLIWRQTNPPGYVPMALI